ncbi:peptidoglycan DD-metalloendopeptidase family protein [Streptomyces sp. ISL-12]|uniref:aggregation-promoting factor C-terminal-like domain-containing protein n=1 Tax=Streptomyces sp. ISL-12 TaxID=2819177 RepID=UPI001BE92CC3|nr:peptidoglycan DD-metalloendopeptidase family protein [Streptomyces sp. ISL-12]MBT2412640.1 peptidoglycan DD-metalloendopeptidase family protein [Streptomyces sp. ISL-12]
MPNLDIVGTAAVDVVPIAPRFHEKLRQMALPAADRVGEEAGRIFGDALSDNIQIAIPTAITRGGRTARPAATRAGDDNAGAFGRAFRNRLEVAFRSLPRPDVRLSTTGFDADLARVRARMESLSGKRIGVDVDVARAAAEIQSIDAQLAALGSRSPNVQVRADIATARAELALIQRQINDVDRDDVNVQVRANTAPAMASLLALSVAIGGVMALPVIPIAAAGIGAIASAATVAAAGVGSLALVAIPAIKGVTEAIQAKSAAEDEAARATDNSAAASKRAAQQALQMESAQQSLAAAHRSASRSIAQANRQIEDAERALGQAAARAMEQRRQAAEAVERAERSLSDAKRQAQRAEEELTKARRDAAQELADLNDELERGKLDEREAALRLKEAEQELAEVRASYDAGGATELEMERAQLAYDQAAQSAKDQRKDYAQLQKDAAAAKAAGVDGDEAVTDAARQLADAQQNVVDQTQAVADAQRGAAQAQVDAAQSVADAQRALADAVDGAAQTQTQAAESIETAERGVESARLSAVDATAQAVTKADEYREALAGMTPAQRELYDSLAGPQGLIGAFKAWSTSLQPDVLPLFTQMVDGATNSLPGLTPLVQNSADAVQSLMDRASADLKRPFWQRFKQGVTDSAEPAIEGLGVSFGNVFKGMAGVVDAFLPHMDGISRRMQSITGSFADWGTGLRGSPEFEGFLDYVRRTGPMVSETLGNIFRSVFDVAKALEPASRFLLEIFGYLAEGVSWIAKNAPEAVIAIYGLYVATKLWSLAMSMNPIGAVIMGLVALALAVKYAWDHWDWFREAVITAWTWIKNTSVDVWKNYLQPFFVWFGGIVVWLWDTILKPYIGFMIAYWTQVGEVFAWVWDYILAPYIGFMIAYWTQVGEVIWWLWEKVFSPVYGFIGELIVWWWENIVLRYIGYVIDIFTTVGDVLTWLWEKVWSPIFGFIGDLIVWWWENIVATYFGYVMDILGAVGDVFKWLYEKGVKPPLENISDIATWLWRKGLKPVFDKIMEGVDFVADAFRSGKDAIGKHWQKVADIAKKPVNFIIEWVYTKGIKKLFDGVSKYVGMDPLPKAPRLLAEGGRTSGGIPGKDSIPALLMADEFVIKRDSARKIGFDNLARMNETGEIPRFKDGGLVGGAWDWTKDTFSDVIGGAIDWGKTAADLMVHPSKIWNTLTKPILSKVADGVGDSKMGKVIGRIPGKMVGGLKDKLVEAVASLTSETGGWGGVWQKPVNANIGTKFGVPGSMWSSGYHTGLDFPAATGTPIKAVANGRVSLATSGGPYGKHVIIDHGGGLQSLYAHMSKLRTTVPKSVNGGSRIGDVGATGNVTGPHLHLEARLNGKAVDPMKYLSGGNSAQAVGAAQQYAKSILGNYGWGASQFAPLKSLWQGESGWRWNAENPSSGAYGIPQALPASKMASAGADWRTNYKTQIRWGLGYIKGRPDYGSPSAAYSKWLSRSPHWYDDGGYLPPGLSLVANGTGRPEPVFTDSQWSTLASAKGGGTTEVHADVRVFVGDREITDIVRTEINTYDAEVATDITNGRWS